MAVVARAQDATLEWEPSPSAPDGYRIYYQSAPYTPAQWNGTGATQGNSPIDVGNVLTYALTGLTDGVWYWFTATAYRNAHCSDAQYLDQATCEAGAGTWTAYAESEFSNIVRSGSGGRLFMGGTGRIRLPAQAENEGRITF